MYTPYQDIFNRQADFRVTYNIYSQEEGGRYHYPFQGIRWDFWYEHPEHLGKGIFMIYPEFEDINGNLITETNLPVPKYGLARMWIVNKERIKYHQDKIKIGTLGFFMEGARRVGECEVIELINLK